MRKKPPHAYFLIILVLLLLMSLPKTSSELLRGGTVAVFAPFWQKLVAFKDYFGKAGAKETTLTTASMEEIQRLQMENQFLHQEILHLKGVMQHELKLLSNLAASKESPFSHQSLAFVKKRHRQELQKLSCLQLEAVAARVIFRSMALWNSSLWINVGKSTNEALGRFVIAKNSPVVINTAVVGVIDFVGKHQSRVRLITDSGLTPSVRALRGDPQVLVRQERIHAFLRALEAVKEDLIDEKEYGDLTVILAKVQERLAQEDQAWYLAKGELHGESKPLWRSERHILKGAGFNYDFSDSQGPARDLRSGKPIGVSDNALPAMPILKAKDLLVTTGMDGVFPPGLLVAEVKTLHSLKEGDYTYELDATPAVGNFDDLSLVFVLPPLGFDSEEQPPFMGW